MLKGLIRYIFTVTLCMVVQFFLVQNKVLYKYTTLMPFLTVEEFEEPSSFFTILLAVMLFCIMAESVLRLFRRR